MACIDAATSRQPVPHFWPFLDLYGEVSPLLSLSLSLSLPLSLSLAGPPTKSWRASTRRPNLQPVRAESKRVCGRESVCVCASVCERASQPLSPVINSVSGPNLQPVPLQSWDANSLIRSSRMVALQT